MQQVSDKETSIILETARECLETEGDFVELGCYRGDTSLVLQKLLLQSTPPSQMSRKALWLYDSFEGLPPKTREDASVAGDAFKAGELLVTKKEVVLRFKKAGLPVPRIKKAFFEDLDPGVWLPPSSSAGAATLDPAHPGDLPPKIAFAFLDGDLYGSIKTSLKLVVSRLAPGAKILIHDYNNPALPGVARAVDEFLRSHPTYRLQTRETLALLTQL